MGIQYAHPMDKNNCTTDCRKSPTLCNGSTEHRFIRFDCHKPAPLFRLPQCRLGSKDSPLFLILAERITGHMQHRQREAESHRFTRAGFPKYFEKSLDNTTKYCLRDFSFLLKIQLLENCEHLSDEDFGGIFRTDDAALLTQGKEDKRKSTQKTT